MAGRSWAAILTGLFLILWGALAITNLQFELQNVIMGALAIMAGICWWIGK